MKNISKYAVIVLLFSSNYIFSQVLDYNSFKVIDSTFYTRYISPSELNKETIKIEKDYLINFFKFKKDELEYSYKIEWGDTPGKFTEGVSKYSYFYWFRFLTNNKISLYSYIKLKDYDDSITVYLFTLDKNKKIKEKLIIDKEFNDEKNGIKSKVYPKEGKIYVAHYRNLFGKEKKQGFESIVVMKEYQIADKFKLISTKTKYLQKNALDYLEYRGNSKKLPKIPTDDILNEY